MSLIESKLQIGAAAGVLDIHGDGRAGSEVVVAPREAGGSPRQQWELRRAKTLTYWNVESALSGDRTALVLTGAAAGRAQLAVAELAAGDDRQRWVFDRDGGLQNRASGLLVSGSGSLAVVAAPDLGGVIAQRWAVTDRGGATYSLDSEDHLGLAISVEQDLRTILRRWEGTDAGQRWRLSGAMHADAFWIRNAATGLVAAAQARAADVRDVKLVLAPQRGPFEDDLQLWFRYQPAAADHLLLRCVATGLVATADGAALPVRAKEQALPEASAGQLWRVLG